MDNQNQLRAMAVMDDIRELLHDEQDDIRRRYDHLYVVFIEVLNEQTAASALTFSGPFAKLDYVCRVMDYPMADLQRLNAFRCRASQTDSCDEVTLRQQWPYDVKAVCHFVTKVYDFQLPDDLRRLLPAVYSPQPFKGVSEDCIRAVVRAVEDDMLIVQSIDGDMRSVKVMYAETDSTFGDFSYLKEMVNVGDRVNVVRPVLRDGAYHPQLIVYQPDFLMDISSIANCFEEYGTTPYAYLINMLAPPANSMAILFGNFASQLLDEAIHQGGQSREYVQSLRTFFRHNALKLSTCTDMNNEVFHENAKRQMRIIQGMVDVTFKQILGYDATKVLLEPSFFCEMLGIQGRMDLLQEDMKVLIEQKSGKMYYKGGHMEKHYVQVLLYRALLHYNYHIPNQQINSFLLYSKYENGLIAEGPAPKLLAEAMRVRNQVVALMLRLAEGEGRDIYGSLSPEILKTKPVNVNFWLGSLLPKLENVLNPIQNAESLVADYFYRMLTFVAHEQVLSKIGTPAKEASGLSALWNATAEEKRAAGSILDSLSITNLNDEGNDSGIGEVVLTRMEQQDDSLPNFREGDIVVLYPYENGRQPNATQTMVIRCSLTHLTPDRVTLKLRAPQKNTSVFKLGEENVRWAIEHDFMESSFTSLYKSVASVLTALPDRQQLLLAQREPMVDSDRQPIGTYGAFDEMVRRFVRTEDYFILIGPPGTGKTSHGLVNILQEELAAGGSVLLLSYTNRAVNEICSKLVEHDIDFLRLGNSATCPEEYRAHVVGLRAETLGNVLKVKQMLTDAKVVVATTTTMLGNTDLFSLRDFSLAIIDEASQILEPHLLGILCAKHKEGNAVRKFVLIGDHKQLPAVVQQAEESSRVTEASLNNMGLVDCRLSLFERLLHACRDKEECVYQFGKQGRMHHDVALFPNQAFYHGSLDEVPLAHQRCGLSFTQVENDNAVQQLLASHRVVFTAVWPEKMSGYGKTNHEEAAVIARIAKEIYSLYINNGRAFLPKETIGVIVPYRHQIAAIQKQLKQTGISSLMDIDIDTVERFQGSQREVIIYGFTIQRFSQLDFLTANIFEEEGSIIDRKLNVALTRAREQMVVVGNPSLLKYVHVFRHLIEHVQEHGCYIDACDLK